MIDVLHKAELKNFFIYERFNVAQKHRSCMLNKNQSTIKILINFELYKPEQWDNFEQASNVESYFFKLTF